MNYFSKFLVLGVFSTIFLRSDAQIVEFQPYIFPEKIPSRYILDPLSIYQKGMMEDMPNCSERDKEIWNEMNAYEEYHLLTSGFVYIGWDELETYMNNIKNKLLPDSVNKNNIRVFVNYSTELNAYTVPTGNIYFNIGMLSELQNESQIAFIMAHEISHYLHRDGKTSFLKEITIEKKGSREDKENISILTAEFSREFEARADSVAFELLVKAGYDVSDISNSLQSFLLTREYSKKVRSQYKRIGNIDKTGSVKKRESNKLLESHPDIAKRIDDLNERIANVEQDESVSSFPQGKVLFKELHSKIMLEILFIFYQNNYNLACLQTAFTYHLFDPTNKLYIYFALESIRRLIYLDPEYVNKDFLTEKYPEYFEEGQGILSDIDFLLLDTTQKKYIKAEDLLINGADQMQNYGQALTYFKKKAMEFQVEEAYLSMALMYLEDEEKKEFFLNKYLTTPNVRYRKYAEQLRNNNLIESITSNEREIVLMEEISMLEERSYGYHLRLKKAYEEEYTYYDEIEKFYKIYFPKTEFIPMSKYRTESFAEYRKLDNVIRAARRFVYYAEELEKEEIRNAEITEGVNQDGSETFVFDDDDEEPLVITGKDKRKYKKKLKSKEYNDEPSRPQELENTEVEDVTNHNIYVYAPYVWEYFEEHNLVKVEYLQLLTYRNATFSNVANNLFFGTRYDHSTFKLRIYTADARLKKADFRYIYRKKEANPNLIEREINNYYAPD